MSGRWLAVLALAALQIPQVRCVAPCHETVHAGVGCPSAEAVHGDHAHDVERDHEEVRHTVAHRDLAPGGDGPKPPAAPPPALPAPPAPVVAGLAPAAHTAARPASPPPRTVVLLL